MGKHDLSDSDDSTEEPEKVYLVEVITEARVAPNEKFEYRVKWYGYGSEDDTWEPEDNVEECKRLLKSFWKDVGKLYKKYPGPIGEKHKATAEWIAKERRHFAEEMQREQAEKAAKKEERKKRKAMKHAGGNDAPTRSRSVKLSDDLNLFRDLDLSSGSDEQPLSKQSKKKGKEKESSRSTTGPSKNIHPSTTKPKPQKLSIQTSSMPTNKFAGMSFTKKPPGASLSNPSASSTVPLNDDVRSKQQPPKTTAIPSPSSSIGYKGPSTQDAGPSKPFLPPRPRSSVPVAPPPVKPPVASSEDVDNLLSTIMSFGGSEAQRPENLASQASNPTTAVPSGLKFAKKWTWSGELFIDYADTAEKLCDITIHSTSETSEIGFRLSAILDSRDSLRFSKSYTRPELNCILQGLRKVDQIVKVSYRLESDREPYSILMKFMIRRNLIISCAAITHQGHVAEMIVFPSANKDLCERFNTPLPYKSADCLLIVLMPWHVPPSKYGERYLRSDEIRELKPEEDLKKIRNEFSTIASRPNIDAAFRVLGFDFSFVKFLPSRKYCIWSFQVDAKPTERGRRFPAVRPETKALLEVLLFLKAENVGYDSAEARVVFVHVGSVRSIQKLPGIVERRCEKPEVQFVTYGTHESVHPSLWGFHEIFPLGGIVTFTATALLENPLQMAELIERLHKHPHWECYILPSVLAVFVRLSCPGEDPLSTYTREPYRFGRILDQIEEGKVALMQSPHFAQVLHDGKELEEWTTTQFNTLDKTPFELLEDCWSTFVAEYSNKTDSELKTTIESEIVKDLTMLQTQQAIRENHRRFVVIKAMQDEHINFPKDGFEWRTAQEFSFRDGYPIHFIDSTEATDQPLAA